MTKLMCRVNHPSMGRQGYYIFIAVQFVDTLFKTIYRNFKGCSTHDRITQWIAQWLATYRGQDKMSSGAIPTLYRTCL